MPYLKQQASFSWSNGSHLPFFLSLQSHPVSSSRPTLNYFRHLRKFSSLSPNAFTSQGNQTSSWPPVCMQGRNASSGQAVTFRKCWSRTLPRQTACPFSNSPTPTHSKHQGSVLAKPWRSSLAHQLSAGSTCSHWSQWGVLGKEWMLGRMPYGSILSCHWFLTVFFFNHGFQGPLKIKSPCGKHGVTTVTAMMAQSYYQPWHPLVIQRSEWFLIRSTDKQQNVIVGTRLVDLGWTREGGR